MLSDDFLLVSQRAFSRTLREKLEQMPPGLRRICGYEHWVDGTYLITEVIESEEDEHEGGEGGVLDARSSRARQWGRVPAHLNGGRI